MSLPYTSRAIDQLIQNAQEMLIKEQEALWQLKKLSNEFRGDQTWVPCDVMQTEHDALFLEQGMPGTPGVLSVAGTTHDTLPDTDVGEDTEVLPLSNGAEVPQSMADAPGEGEIVSNPEVEMDSDIHDKDEKAEDIPETNGIKAEIDLDEQQLATKEPTDATITNTASEPAQNGATDTTETAQIAPANPVPPQDTQPDTEDTTMPDPLPQGPEDNAQQHKTAITDPTNSATTTAPPASPDFPHPMTTRTRARAPLLPSTTSTPTSLAPSPSMLSPHLQPTSIHPLFIPPLSCLPSRNLGLPAPEADDTRRLLYAYVQRQEEVVRGVERLWLGLLKAKRLRDSVAEWADAEGHVGELSDGEDWVDTAAWGLADGELGKGEEAEEEEEGVGRDVRDGGKGKKTRGRAKERDGVAG